MTVLLTLAVTATLADALALVLVIAPGRASEVNPIATFLIERIGYGGAVALKIALAVGLVALTAIIGRSDHHVVRRSALLGFVLVVAITSGTVGTLTTLAA